MNPNHYNEKMVPLRKVTSNGTFKTMQKLKQRHQELCRIAAENLSVGNPWAGQSSSVWRLLYHRTAKCKETTKRANPENPVDKNGTNEAKKRRKIHKKSCPGYLQAKAKQLF